MYKLQRDITPQFAKESVCQMPWKETPRNSGIKTGRWSVRFLSGSQNHKPNLCSEANLRENNVGSMAEISLHVLSILKKHMTEFLGINCGRFCRSMALMVNYCAPLSHSTSKAKKETVKVELKNFSFPHFPSPNFKPLHFSARDVSIFSLASIANQWMNKQVSAAKRNLEKFNISYLTAKINIKFQQGCNEEEGIDDVGNLSR